MEQVLIPEEEPILGVADSRIQLRDEFPGSCCLASGRWITFGRQARGPSREGEYLDAGWTWMCVFSDDTEQNPLCWFPLRVSAVGSDTCGTDHYRCDFSYVIDRSITEVDEVSSKSSERLWVVPTVSSIEESRVVRFATQISKRYRLDLYDVLGRRVAPIADSITGTGSVVEVAWRGTMLTRNRVPAGVYWVGVSTSDGAHGLGSARIVLLRWIV